MNIDRIINIAILVCCLIIIALLITWTSDLEPKIDSLRTEVQASLQGTSVETAKRFDSLDKASKKFLQALIALRNNIDKLSRQQAADRASTNKRLARLNKTIDTLEKKRLAAMEKAIADLEKALRATQKKQQDLEDRQIEDTKQIQKELNSQIGQLKERLTRLEGQLAKLKRTTGSKKIPGAVRAEVAQNEKEIVELLKAIKLQHLEHKIKFLRLYYSKEQWQNINLMEIKMVAFRERFGRFPKDVQEFRKAIAPLKNIPKEEKSKSSELKFKKNGQGGWYYDQETGRIFPDDYLAENFLWK